jgi:hypothetical protein
VKRSIGAWAGRIRPLVIGRPSQIRLTFGSWRSVVRLDLGSLLHLDRAFDQLAGSERAWNASGAGPSVEPVAPVMRARCADRWIGPVADWPSLRFTGLRSPHRRATDRRTTSRAGNTVNGGGARPSSSASRCVTAASPISANGMCTVVRGGST